VRSAVFGWLFAVSLTAGPGAPVLGPEGLVAAGPAPGLEEKLRLYGQFVGQWEFDVVNYPEKGGKTTGRGEWNFAWVLEGRAIQDVWITPPRGQRGRAQSARGGYGTTIRFYDAGIDAWRILWVDPIHANVQRFVARLRDGEIVQEEAAPEDGQPGRWIFSEITTVSFRWRSESSPDGGKTWRLQQEMRVRRKGREGAGLAVAPNERQVARREDPRF
jgi:hypothetical protein